LVSVWEPDCADLDTRELLKADPGVRGVPAPRVGFVSWLSDRVFTGVDGVVVHSCERFRDGSLLSVDLTSPTLLEDTVALSRELKARGVLHPIPANQSDPPVR
ncbi:MAG: hypothetical protein ACRCSP_02200, partial [Rhodoglobus sp.]